MKNKCKLGSLLITTLISITVLAQPNDEYGISTSGDVIDDYVVYNIGGGSAASRPLTRHKLNSIGLGIGWNGNLMCGNMDIATTVQIN